MRLPVIWMFGLCLLGGSVLQAEDAHQPTRGQERLRTNLPKHQAETQDQKRRRQIWSVADRSDEPALQWISAIVRDDKEPEEYRIVAAKVLAQMPHPHAVLVLTMGIRTSWPLKVRTNIVQALGQHKLTEGVPALLGLINDGPEGNPLFMPALDAMSQFPHHQALDGELPADTVAVLTRAFDRSSDPGVQAGILEALGSLRKTEAIPYLFSVVKNPKVSGLHRYMSVRAWAVRTLGKMVDIDGVLAMADILKTETVRDVRDQLIQIIGRTSGVEALRVILNILITFDPDRPGSQQDVEAAIGALADHGNMNLGLLPEEVARALVSVYQRPRGIMQLDGAAERIVNKLPEECQQQVTAGWLTSPNETVRVLACRMSKRWRTPDIVSALVKAVEREPEPTIQIMMIESLGDLYGVGQVDALPVLRKLKLHQSERVRSAASEALEKWETGSTKDGFLETPR